MADTREALAEDTNFLADMKKTCAGKQKEWDIRSKTRSEEMLALASQADVALIMVLPCACNFTFAIAKGNHKAGEIQGPTHQHSRFLGVKQIAIGCSMTATPLGTS